MIRCLRFNGIRLRSSRLSASRCFRPRLISVTTNTQLSKLHQLPQLPLRTLFSTATIISTSAASASSFANNHEKELIQTIEDSMHSSYNYNVFHDLVVENWSFIFNNLDKFSNKVIAGAVCISKLFAEKYVEKVIAEDNLVGFTKLILRDGSWINSSKSIHENCKDQTKEKLAHFLFKHIYSAVEDDAEKKLIEEGILYNNYFCELIATQIMTKDKALTRKFLRYPSSSQIIQNLDQEKKKQMFQFMLYNFNDLCPYFVAKALNVNFEEDFGLALTERLMKTNNQKFVKHFSPWNLHLLTRTQICQEMWEEYTLKNIERVDQIGSEIINILVSKPSFALKLINQMFESDKVLVDIRCDTLTRIYAASKPTISEKLFSSKSNRQKLEEIYLKHVELLDDTYIYSICLYWDPEFCSKLNNKLKELGKYKYKNDVTCEKFYDSRRGLYMCQK